MNPVPVSLQSLHLSSRRRAAHRRGSRRLQPTVIIEKLEDRRLLSLNVSSFPTPMATVDRIVKGRDGNLWFTGTQGTYQSETGVEGKIGSVTPAGKVTVFPLPSGDAPTGGITTGPDGNLWFTSTKGIDRITSAGAVTEFALPSDANPRGITAGVDGNVWFSDTDHLKIGRITTNGQFRFYALAAPSDGVTSITAGPDGNLWYATAGTDSSGKSFGELARFKPKG